MALGIADQVIETNGAAAEGADLFIVSIPVGQCGAAAREIAPHLGCKTLQETLQLCTDKCGKSACKDLQGRFFYRRCGTEANENLSVFHELAPENLHLPADRATGS
jgi:hypothetical protein